MMRHLRLLFFLYFLTDCTFLLCQDELEVTGLVVDITNSSTKNESFINNQIKVVTDKDTVILNLKLPYEIKQRRFINNGLYENCKINIGNVYSLTLRSICVSDLSKDEVSYYHSNAIFTDSLDCSYFTEFNLDTEYNYFGNYGRYVDMNNHLYEIVNFSPIDNCDFRR